MRKQKNQCIKLVIRIDFINCTPHLWFRWIVIENSNETMLLHQSNINEIGNAGNYSSMQEQWWWWRAVCGLVSERSPGLPTSTLASSPERGIMSALCCVHSYVFRVHVDLFCSLWSCSLILSMWWQLIHCIIISGMGTFVCSDFDTSIVVPWMGGLFLSVSCFHCYCTLMSECSVLWYFVQRKESFIWTSLPMFMGSSKVVGSIMMYLEKSPKFKQRYLALSFRNRYQSWDLREQCIKLTMLMLAGKLICMSSQLADEIVVMMLAQL